MGSFSIGTASVPTTKVVSELVSSIAVKVNGNITMDGKAKVEVTTETSGFGEEVVAL